MSMRHVATTLFVKRFKELPLAVDDKIDNRVISEEIESTCDIVNRLIQDNAIDGRRIMQELQKFVSFNGSSRERFLRENITSSRSR